MSKPDQVTCTPEWTSMTQRGDLPRAIFARFETLEQLGNCCEKCGHLGCSALLSLYGPCIRSRHGPKISSLQVVGDHIRLLQDCAASNLVKETEVLETGQCKNCLCHIKKIGAFDLSDLDPVWYVHGVSWTPFVPGFLVCNGLRLTWRARGMNFPGRTFSGYLV